MSLTERRINFFHPDKSKWDNILAGRDIEIELSSVSTGRDAWIITTYYCLRDLGLRVELSTDFRRGEVCVCHFDDFIRQDIPWDCFVIVIRADRPRSFLCQFEVVQNPLLANGNKIVYMPHWQQPNLIPRDAKRGLRIEKVGYFGLLKNLSTKFRTGEFKRRLETIGITFEIIDAREKWSDYSDIDLILAVRDGTQEFLSSKPPTKLFNAWLAKCPILVGDEPAYRHYQKSRWDYIMVEGVDSAINEIQALKNDPKNYLKMLENCSLREVEVNRCSTAKLWRKFLEEEVLPEYEKYIAMGKSRRILKFLGCWIVSHIRGGLRGRSYSRGYDMQGNRLPGPTMLRKLLLRIDAILFERDSTIKL